MLKKFLAGAAIATSLLAVSNTASATVLTNWFIDTDGAGANPAVLVNNYLDLNGRAYVSNAFDLGSTTNFSFQEVGSFLTILADGTRLLNPLLSSSFVASGTGTTGGSLVFTAGGTLKVFSGATDIADFSLQSGSALLNANSTLPNGTVSLIFKADHMVSGYFFDSGMNDLASIANSSTGLLLGFATTNVISLADDALGVPLASPPNVDPALITAYNSAFGTALGTVQANDSTDLLLSNNGQFRLAVPEPSMLSLLGLALLGVGFTTRRKSKA